MLGTESWTQGLPQLDKNHSTKLDTSFLLLSLSPFCILHNGPLSNASFANIFSDLSFHYLDILFHRVFNFNEAQLITYLFYESRHQKLVSIPKVIWVLS